tara:strand:+ start:420 stop:608 length:189 start_codon:yes stop_codon:yes gene_type:complete
MKLTKPKQAPQETDCFDCWETFTPSKYYFDDYFKTTMWFDELCNDCFNTRNMYNTSTIEKTV